LILPINAKKIPGRSFFGGVHRVDHRRRAVVRLQQQQRLGNDAAPAAQRLANRAEALSRTFPSYHLCLSHGSQCLRMEVRQTDG
jgi:hypothetical protein